MYNRIPILFGLLFLIAAAPSSDGFFWRNRAEDDKPASSASPANPAPVSQAGPSVPIDTDVEVVRGTETSAVTRTPLLQVDDDEAEQVLVRLAQARQLREEEIRVLGRLSQEKDQELQRMNAQLEQRFGILADDNYQYDQEAQAVYRITPKAEAEAGADDAGVSSAEDLFDRELHRRLESEEDELAFVRLVSAKKITVSELAMLRLLLREKSLELERVMAALKDRFSIEPGKHYQYDAPSRTLFEVAPASP